MAAMQDRTKYDIYVTSKHRTTAQVEWSRQLSRETPPFFMTTATANVRGNSTYNAERPRRHLPTPHMDPPLLPNPGPKPDARDYEPKLYEEIHPHCGVKMDKMAPRGNVFNACQHKSETVVDINRSPGWVKKHSSMGMASRFPEYDAEIAQQRIAAGTPDPTSNNSAMLPDKGKVGESIIRARERKEKGLRATKPHLAEMIAEQDRQRATPQPTPVYSAYKPIPVLATPCVESKMRKPPGGKFDKSSSQRSPRNFKTLTSDLPEYDVNYDAVMRQKPKVNLGQSTRTQGRPKYSEEKRDMFKKHEKQVREAIEYGLLNGGAETPNPAAATSDASALGGSAGSPSELMMDNMDHLQHGAARSPSHGGGSSGIVSPAVGLGNRYQKPRVAPGYATQRQTYRRDVGSLLAMADADARRARKLMEANFGPHARSQSRNSMLYTPSPSPGPTE